VTGEFRPPLPQAITIDGPAGSLEARLEDPAAGARPRHVGVICHPHPQFGGTMQNKVVHTLARAMQELGAPTVRFNFRGVGASAGTYGDGAGEARDALAAIRWARAHWDCDGLWLAGFSFGAAIALNVTTEALPAALVTVAPPVKRVAITLTARPACPWLIVQGDADDLVRAEDVDQWASRFSPPPRVAKLAGAEHFFHGRLGDLRSAVIEFLREPGG
jgi:alpha/beta superfamily hydrolase